MAKSRNSRRGSWSADKPYVYRPEQFSKHQLERLGALQVQATTEFANMNRAALSRLAFAQYLVREGIISEGLAGNGVELVEGYEPELTVDSVDNRHLICETEGTSDGWGE